jgi:hypothetical protein
MNCEQARQYWHDRRDKVLPPTRDEGPSVGRDEGPTTAPAERSAQCVDASQPPAGSDPAGLEASASWRDHLDACPACAAYVAEMEELNALLGGLQADTESIVSRQPEDEERATAVSAVLGIDAVPGEHATEPILEITEAYAATKRAAWIRWAVPLRRGMKVAAVLGFVVLAGWFGRYAPLIDHHPMVNPTPSSDAGNADEPSDSNTATIAAGTPNSGTPGGVAPQTPQVRLASMHLEGESAKRYVAAEERSVANRNVRIVWLYPVLEPAAKCTGSTDAPERAGS